MRNLNLNYQWDRPLVDRAFETLAALRERAAIDNASAEQLEERARRMTSAYCREQNRANYSRHVSAMAAVGSATATHYRGLASITRQTEEALDSIADAIPVPPTTRAEAEAAAEAFAASWLALPESLPTVAAPSDGRGVPSGLSFFGEIRGTALFTDRARRLFVRNHAGELQAWSSPERPRISHRPLNS